MHTCIKVLEAIEYKLFPFARNLQVAVSRVDSSSNKPIVFDDHLLNAVLLLFRTNDIRSRRPQ